jgi:nucleotide-binding universal stress UspA family protein
MYKHILLPTDGSELSKRAVNHGIALAKALNARLTALVVSTPIHTLIVEPDLVTQPFDEYKKLIVDQTEKYLGMVRDSAVASGVTCDGVRIEHGLPYEAIIDTATKKGCDLIVMASHGLSGVSPIMLGSETLKVLTQTKIPVLVYR